MEAYKMKEQATIPYTKKGNETMASVERKWIELWPGGAPGAQGEGDEDKPALMAYPAKETGRGAVIVIPGGGYGMRAAHEGEPIALWLNALGIHAFVLRYRVAPYRHPAPLLDARRAVRYVRHEASRYGIDPAKIGVLGFSAGGHLTTSVGTHYDGGDRDAEDPIDRVSCRPDAILPCYPVVTFLGPHAHEGSRINLLGDSPAGELVESLSNESRVTPDTPPTFLWHTADDAVVPVENALLFAAALSRNKVPFDLHVYESGRHGMGLAEDDPHVATWTEVCGLWLKRRGF